MRIGTLNIQHGAHSKDSDSYGQAPDAKSLTALADEIARFELDVLCLQEVDQGQRRSGGLNQTEILARELHMPHYRFAAFFQGWVGGPRRTPLRSDANGRMAFGLATLSRLPVTAWRVHRMNAPLPTVRLQMGSVRHPSSFLRFVDTSRTLLAATMTRDGGREIAVGNVHLPAERPIARRLLREVSDTLATIPGDRLLAGDLALEPGDVGAITGAETLAEGLTYPTGKPRRQVDHLLGVGLTATACGAEPLQYSDHRLLWADLM